MLGARIPHTGKKLIAIADVASGSVGVAILEVHGHSAHVLAAERSILPLEERSHDATIAQIAEHLTEAGKKAVAAYTARAGKARAMDSLFCVIRAPWSKSRTARAVSKFDKEQKINHQVIGALAKQALADQKDFDPSKMLEASVVRTELNGYPTAEPEGKSAHSVGIAALLSDWETDIRATIEPGLEAIFPHLSPMYRSSTHALLSALSERKDRDDDHMIVDMTSEGTALMAMRDGAVGDQQLLPEGVRTILKRIAPSGMAEETLSLIRMLGRDQCSTAACDAIRASMAKVEPELVRIFGEGLSACAATRRLPNRLILIVHPDMADWFAGFFARIDFAQFTQTTQPFSVQLFSSKDLAAHVVPAQGVVIDPGLALCISLVNTEG